MNKEFIPYEQALELKELDYDKPCFGWYHDNILEVDFKIRANEIIKHHELLGRFKGCCLAPTFSQAFRWLLEKHNLYGIIIPTVTMAWTFKTMTAVIGMVEVPPYSHVEAYDYNSREEAEQACLEKLIKLVKNK
jgi:hypothetical protein